MSASSRGPREMGGVRIFYKLGFSAYPTARPSSLMGIDTSTENSHFTGEWRRNKANADEQVSLGIENKRT